MADNPAGTKRGRWLVDDALVWIVFRLTPSDAPLVRPDSGPLGWKVRPDFMACLAARAVGRPEVWPEPGQVIPRWFPFDPDSNETISPDNVHALLDREKIRMGMSDAELYAFALQERDRYETEKKDEEKQEARLNEALDDLNQAVADGALVAWGRPSPTREKLTSPPVREPIPAHCIDEKRQIGRDGKYSVRRDLGGSEWQKDRGPFFYDIEVKTADVIRLWPGITDSANIYKPLNIPEKASKRQFKGFNYTAQDAPLVREAVRGIKAKEYIGPMDAARAFASKATGHGQEDSKAKRLLKGIQRQLAADHD